MPTELTVLQIESFDPKGRPALSLYLDTDPSRGPGRNLRAQLEEALRPVSKSLSDDEGVRLQIAADMAIAGVALLETVPRGAAVFVSPELGFLRVVPLPESVGAIAHWSPEFHVSPLLAALDEHERTVVVLVDKEQARVFRVFMGQIEEVAHFTEHEKDGQRGHEWHVRKHMEHVLAALRSSGAATQVDRILLGGGEETVYEFLRLLPRRIRDRTRLIAGIPAHSSATTVLARVARAQYEAEREEEEELVDNLTDRDSARSVFGAAAVIEAVADARVHTLVYASEIELEGSECSACGWLTTGSSGPSCPRCGAGMRGFADLMERLVSRVLHAGGRVEEARGPARRTLLRSEGLAALLRYVPSQASYTALDGRAPGARR